GWMAAGSGLHESLASPLRVVCALTQPFFATCIILKTSMRGAGATSLVMRAAFSSMISFRVGVLWAVAECGPLALTWGCTVLGTDLLTQSVIFTCLHFKGKWLEAKV